MGDKLLTSDILMIELSTLAGHCEGVKRNPVRRDKLEALRFELNRLSKEHENLSPYYEKMSMASTSHMDFELEEMARTGKPIRKEPPNAVRGNYQVWRSFEAIKNVIKKYNFSRSKEFKDTMDIMHSGLSSALYRLGDGVMNSEKIKLRNIYCKHIESASKFLTMSELLRQLRNEANSKLNTERKSAREAFRYDELYRLDELPSSTSSIGIAVYSLDRVIILSVGTIVSIMTQTHYNRLLQLLDSFGHLIYGAAQLKPKYDPSDIPDIFMESFSRTIDEDADYLGEVIKGCKNVIVSELADDKIMNENPGRAMLETMTEFRRKNVEYALSRLRPIFKAREDLINFLNVYKITPHADTNLYEVFESIRGVTHPNKVSARIEERFKGTLRRALYKSLKSQGYDIRLDYVINEGRLGERITTIANSAAPDRTVLSTASYSHWANVRFRPVLGVSNPNEMVIPISSKSSQSKGPVSIDELESILKETITRDEEPKVKYKTDSLKTVNDASETIRYGDNINTEAAIKRFERVVALHREFESKYPGILPEDIPSEDLENFLRDRPEASYLVGTEPKFGEYHKKVTRLFYMAEQELKSITQRAERVGRQVSGKQFGVSIVKSFRAARVDLESFCYSMNKGEDTTNVFVSFDMSEFSKKFPMELLRYYGEVLEEITGVNWLTRLDVIFRASVVIHNTRGYFDKIGGVKGGFEGFLNFIWSSIHAIIMEMSLDATGVTGALLTFSDDGLLLFTIKRINFQEEARAKVMAIQRVYRNCGLVFHIVKTLVSTVVWEYLGVVCYLSRFLPAWVKELCSIGKTETGRGLNPLQYRIRSIESQSNALATAGGDAIISYVLKYYHAAKLLRYTVSDLPLDVIELLFLVPSSAGGFRLMSPFESISSTTIEKDSEIIADFYLSSFYNKRFSASFYSGLLSKSTTVSRPIDSVLSGTRFVASLPDTSGMRVLNEAVEEILSNYGSKANISSNPLRTELADKLNAVILGIDNLDVQIISDVIYATPQWKLYSDSLALVKGSGAIKLISRSIIKQLQAKDRKLCQQSIDFWRVTYLSSNSLDIPYKEFVDIMTDRSFPECNLVSIRPSPRVALRPTLDNPLIMVEVDHPSYESYASALYIEPHTRFQKDYTTISWNAERGETFTTKSVRKFAETVARILISSPESEPFIRVLASAVGVQIPMIPRGVLRGAHRGVGSHGGERDISLSLPKVYDFFSDSRYLEPYRDLIYTMDRADRTTYLSCAKAITYFRWLANNIEDFSPKATKYSYVYSAIPNTVTVMHANRFPTPNSKLPLPWIVPSIAPPIATEYREAFMEHITFHRWYSSLDNARTPDIKLTNEEKIMLNHLAIRGVANWINDVIRSKGTRTIPETYSPNLQFNQAYIFRKAVVIAAWKNLRASFRRELQRLIREASENRYNDEYMRRISESYSFVALKEGLQTGVDILINASLPGCSEADLSPIVQGGYNVIKDISSFITENMLVRPGQLIVVKTKASMTGKFTEVHRKAYQEAYDNTIDYLYDLCKGAGWREDSIRRSLTFGGNIDDILDVMACTKSILRSSEHRGLGKPYNTTSARIQLAKFYLVLTDILASDLTFDNFKDFCTEAETSREFNADEPAIGESLGMKVVDFEVEAGPDHRNLMSEPFPPEMLARMFVHYKVRRSNPSKYLGTIVNKEHQYLFDKDKLTRLITHFYTAILAPAAESISEYPREVEDELLSTFVPSSSATVQLLSVRVQPRLYIGRIRNCERLRDPARGEFVRLINSHLENFVRYSGIMGFKRIQGEGEFHTEALANLVVDHGETISPIYSDSKTNYKYGVVSCNDPNVAMTTYVNLSLIQGSLVTIFKDATTEEFLITFCLHAENLKFRDERFCTPDEPTFGIDVSSSRDLISTMTMSQRTDMSSASSIASSARALAAAAMMPRNAILYTYARTVGGLPQVNDMSVMLQAACDIAKEPSNSANMLGAYSAMLLWAAGREDPIYIPRMSSMVITKLNDPNLRRELVNDIAFTWTWLAASQVSPSLDLDVSRIGRYRGPLSALNPPVEIPITVQARKIRCITEVRTLLDGANTKNLIGNLQDILYEKLPELPALAYDMDNEEPANRVIDEELENIFG